MIGESTYHRTRRFCKRLLHRWQDRHWRAVLRQRKRELAAIGKHSKAR